MKNILLFFAALVIGIVLVICCQILRQTIIHPVAPLRKTQFSLGTAPSDSLRGSVLSFSGSVGWESRTATPMTKLAKKRIIQQGEALETKDDGSVRVQFPNTATLDLSSDTHIDFAQTLPINLVLGQTKGTTTYTKAENRIPLSIRALDLLINIASGSSQIIVDPDQNLVTVNVTSGQATAAYDDTKYISHVITIPQGQQFVFDDGGRGYTLE